MNRVVLIVLILSLVFGITACGEGSGDGQIIRDDIVDVFETGIEEEFPISDENYNKYNEIIGYLYEYPDKSEETLYEELSAVYGETPEELSDFMEDNVLDAIARDMAENTVTVEDVDHLVRKFVKENIVGNSVSIDSIDSEIQGVGALSHFDLEVDGRLHTFIIKFDFSDDYRTARVTQVKLDGLNIDY